MTPNELFIECSLLPDGITSKWGSLSNLCRYCKKPVGRSEAKIAHSYWNAVQFICHEGCFKEGKSSEAYECQQLDADCNDCRDFKRERNLGNGVFEGTCVKYNKPTKAQPNKCTAHKCFTHRKDKEV